MDYFLLVASVSLVFQVAVFILLLGGWMLKKMRLFRVHGVFMFVGVALHLFTIGILMGPSFFLAFIPMVGSSPLSLSLAVAIVHAGLGSIAAVLGVWIVGAWRLRRDLKYCIPMKKWMRRTFFVWSGALVLGFILYLSLFWNLLLG